MKKQQIENQTLASWSDITTPHDDKPPLKSPVKRNKRHIPQAHLNLSDYEQLRQANLSEESIVCELAEWFKSNYPEYALCWHVDKDNKANGDQKKQIAKSLRSKKMGNTAGYPDIFVAVMQKTTIEEPHPEEYWANMGVKLYTATFFGGLFLEAKRLKGTCQPNQLDYHEVLRKQGYCVEVGYGLAHCQEIIEGYLGKGGGE